MYQCVQYQVPTTLSIDLDHVVPDELHLFLRLMDVLIANLISYAVELDIRATRKQTDLLQGATKVQASIQSYGVSLKKKDNPEELDWTSLGGVQKQKVLSLLLTCSTIVEGMCTVLVIHLFYIYYILGL